MREKGKHRKVKKILIRVDEFDKDMAEDLSRQAGMNTSEFFRHMLHSFKEEKQLELHLRLVENNKELAKELKAVLGTVKRKSRG